MYRYAIKIEDGLYISDYNITANLTQAVLYDSVTIAEGVIDSCRLHRYNPKVVKIQLTDLGEVEDE